MGHDKLLELLERVRKAAEEVLPPLPAARKATLTVMAAAAAAAKPLIYSAAAARPTSLKHDSQNDGIVSIALEAGVFGSRRRRRRNADGDDNDGGEPKDSSVAVVELGAGRGYLGAAAADALVRLDEEEQQDGSDYNEGKESPRLSLKCSSLTLVDRRVSFLFFQVVLRWEDETKKLTPLSLCEHFYKHQAYRNKAERHYRSFIGSGSGEEARRTAAAAVERRKPPFELCRATVNLEDVVLSSLPGVAASASMALLGKHLCGSATDLSLRAAVTQLRLSTREGGEGGGGGGEQGMKKESGGEKHSLSGIAVATCCHHCCSWSDFAGKREFLGLGFTADEFEVVSQASAWATGGHGRPASKEKREKREKKRKSKSDDDGDCSSSEQEEDDVDDEEEEEQGIEGETALQPRCWQSRIPIADRRAAGDAAKRLLDGCRVRWLKRQAATRRSGRRELGDKEREKEEGEKPASSSLLVVEAREYAPEGMTGENRLIVAVPRGGGRRTEGGSFKVQPKK